jgi:hypothetical protein
LTNENPEISNRNRKKIKTLSPGVAGSILFERYNFLMSKMIPDTKTNLTAESEIMLD